MPSYKVDPRHEPLPPTKRCNGKVRGKVSTIDGDRAYCSQPAGHGTDHQGFGRCRYHGGAAPQYGKAAQKLAAEDAVATYGLPQKTDPHTALMEELERTAGHVSWLFIKVTEMEEHDLTGLVGQEGKSESGGWHHASVEPSVWVKMYQEERKHLVQVSKVCLQAGIEERRVRIAEQQGQLIAQVIMSIVKRLGVDNHPELPSIVREELTVLSSSRNGSEGEGDGVVTVPSDQVVEV